MRRGRFRQKGVVELIPRLPHLLDRRQPAASASSGEQNHRLSGLFMLMEAFCWAGM
jgi:hypothetical protein